MIEVDRVSRSYGPLKAVDDVSFRVAAGQIVALLGPNGAGKTTLLRMLATLIRPDGGHIRVAGHDVADEPQAVRAALGYQTGDTGLYGRLTPREFLQYFADLHQVDPPLARRRIAQLVDDFGIDEFAGRPCSTLSTGQKQRVVLARTLIHDPPVVVLDEPTSGLDILSSAFILQSIRTLAKQGRAVLFSTHILSEVELLCDRIVLMHRGRHLAEGTLGEVLALGEAPTLSHAFLEVIRRADADAKPTEST